MPSWRQIVFWTVVMALMAPLAAGCGLFFGDPGFKSDYKFKIAVMPFTDMAGVGGSAVEWNTARLATEELATRDDIVVVPHETVRQYILDNNIPLPINQNAAAIIGRAMGVNAVVMGAISDLSQIQMRKGWREWFAFATSRHDYVQAMLVANVVESASGTLLGTDLGTAEVDTGLDEDEMMAGGARYQVPQDKIAASMEDAIEDLVDNVVASMSKASWKGFIGNVSGDTAVLKAGSELGISEGDILLAFSPGDVIVNEIGQSFVVPGPVKARLEVAEVQAHTATLKVLSGAVMPGEVVQPPLDD